MGWNRLTHQALISGSVWLSLGDRAAYYRVRVRHLNADGTTRSKHELELDAINHVIIRIYGYRCAFIPDNSSNALSGKVVRRARQGSGEWYTVKRHIDQAKVTFP